MAHTHCISHDTEHLSIGLYFNCQVPENDQITCNSTLYTGSCVFKGVLTYVWANIPVNCRQHIVDIVSIRHMPICTYKLFGHVLFVCPKKKINQQPTTLHFVRMQLLVIPLHLISMECY